MYKIVLFKVKGLKVPVGCVISCKERDTRSVLIKKAMGILHPTFKRQLFISAIISEGNKMSLDSLEINLSNPENQIKEIFRG